MDNVSLVHSPHPLLAAAGRQHYMAPFAPGESILSYLNRNEIRLGLQPLILTLNGVQIPQDQWGTTFPCSGQIIHLRATVQGGDSNPLRTVLMLAVMVAAPIYGVQLGASMGLSTATIAGTTMSVASVVGVAVISMAGVALVNTLVPPPTPHLPQYNQDNPSPTYSLSGGTNSARLFEPLPLLLGEHRIFPDLGAREYTEFKGEDQYLMQLFNFGLSNLDLSDFRIGNTPLSEYSDVTTEESGADGALDLFPGNVDSLLGGQLENPDGGTHWITRTTSINATALAVDITASLYRAGDSGIESRSVEIEIQYRKVSDSAWRPAEGLTRVEQFNAASRGYAYATTCTDFESIKSVSVASRHSNSSCVLDTSYGITADGTCIWVNYGCRATFNVEGSTSIVTLTNDTRKPLRKTWYWPVDSGQYEVRCRKVSTDESDVRNTAVVSWAALRSYQPDAADYSGQKRYAMKIRASGQLLGRVDRLSALGKSRCEVWNGTNWVADQITSNPAWLYRWFANGLCEGGGVPGTGAPIFGAQLPDSRLDLDALKEWGSWCDANNLKANLVIDSRQSCSEVLNIIARCGRAAPTWTTGKLGVVWDQADQPVSAIYGMPNIAAGSFSVDYATEKLADEIVARFINPALDWSQDTVRVTVPGVTSASRPITVDLVGVTSVEQAAKEANLLAAAQHYRRRRYTWESDLEGMISSRGDVVTLSHDLTQWGTSGRLAAGTTTALTLDREVEFTPSTQHYITIREPHGDWGNYRVQEEDSATDQITLLDALPAAPDDGQPIDWLYCFDPAATPGKQVKIVSIEPINENRVRLSAVDEDAGYYAAESGDFTIATADLSALNPRVLSIDITETWDIHSRGAVEAHIIWTAERAMRFILRITEKREDGAPLHHTRYEVETSSNSQIVQLQEGRLYGITVSAVGTIGRSHRISRDYKAVGRTAPPADVEQLRASSTGAQTRLDWSPVPDPDLDYYRVAIRWDNNGTGTHPATQWREVRNTYMTFDTPLAGSYSASVYAVDTSGNLSLNPAEIQTTTSRPFAENEWYNSAPSYTEGSFSGAACLASDGSLRRPSIAGSAVGIIDDAEDCGLQNYGWGLSGTVGSAMESALGSWFSDMNLDQPGEWRSGVIDFGEVLNGVLVIDATAETIAHPPAQWQQVWGEYIKDLPGTALIPDEGGVRVYARVGNQPDLSDAQEISWGVIEARYAELVVEFETVSRVVEQSVAAGLTLRVDLPDVVDHGRATIASGSITIPFNRTFHQTPALNITGEGGGTSALDSVTKNQFTVSGSDNKTFNWQAQGV